MWSQSSLRSRSDNQQFSGLFSTFSQFAVSLDPGSWVANLGAGLQPSLGALTCKTVLSALGIVMCYVPGTEKDFTETVVKMLSSVARFINVFGCEESLPEEGNPYRWSRFTGQPALEDRNLEEETIVLAQQSLNGFNEKNNISPCLCVWTGSIPVAKGS